MVTEKDQSIHSEPSTTERKVLTGRCCTWDCMKPAQFQCPTCVKQNLPRTAFCSQECFKTFWPEHNQVHKVAAENAKFKPPSFDYTGPLRPHYVTPMRGVPEHIQRPDYHLTGIPASERAVRGTNVIHINSKEEIEGIRKACRFGREVLDAAHRHIRPGITTEEIDRLVHKACIDRNCYPSPLNYNEFPKACCTSVNEIICHGIPDARPLEDGDIVNVDISVYHNGFHADLNETYCVGNVDPKYKKLIKVTHDALEEAISYVKPGMMARDFGKYISKTTAIAGFSVVRSYCGHGIGRLFHEPAPNIPHYAKNKAIGVLKPGMVFTIEPMINEGTWVDVTWPDDWTSATKDGKRSAQFEHTLLVTDIGVEVLTARTRDSPPLWWEQDQESVKEAKKEEKNDSSEKTVEPKEEKVKASEEKVKQGHGEMNKEPSKQPDDQATKASDQPKPKKKK